MSVTAAVAPSGTRRLLADRRGVSIIEFALTLPLLIAAGGYGVELSNYALTHLRVSQYALNLADNASRVGVFAGAGVTNMRESDINDVLRGARMEGAGINLTTHGRVTLSSLERIRQPYDAADSTPVQRIHWQRCLGQRDAAGYGSSYGVAGTLDGTEPIANRGGVTAADGMGEATSRVQAPPNSGVMFVEINYDYQRLFGELFMGPAKIKYIASFIVRDNRNFSQLFNPIPAATRSTCDRFNAEV